MRKNCMGLHCCFSDGVRKVAFIRLNAVNDLLSPFEQSFQIDLTDSLYLEPKDMENRYP